MTIHIGAEPGQIAPAVLMPGDPMRAKFFAETYLEDVFCFNRVRGMLGYTGSYKGKLVSVMGSGMGMPSIAIYVNELISSYGVNQIIRVGTCGAFQPYLNIGDVILAMTASTNSQMNQFTFGGLDYAPAASFDLLLKAYEAAKKRGTPVQVGGIFSGDSFYSDNVDYREKLIEYGVLAVEMEASALYTLASKFGIKALAILTVSDASMKGERATSEQREKSFTQMAEIALEIVD